MQMLGHTVLFLACGTLVMGHGRVTQPPSRASAWRLGFPTPANYDDDGLNCGGFSTQWSTNGGKCGICGDAYSIPPPRPHELGGTYGLGVIVAKYLSGATIATTTQLTASHMGYWEFKLCPDPTDNSQACFDQHILVSEDGETKYTPTRGSGVYEVNYKLPSGLICEHCVLQWRYVAGNNWGICSNGTSGLGCGNQEEFRACSDIAIGVSKTLNNAENIPSPLFYYLQHGFYEVDQGSLTRKDPKRPTAPQRPLNTKPSNRQPKPSKEVSQTPQRPQPNRQPQNSNQQQQHSNRQPQPLNRQPHPSSGQPQYSNGQQYPQNQLYPSQHLVQQYPQNSNRQYPSKDQSSPQKPHGHSQRLTQITQQPHSSNRPTQHSYRQPQRSKQQPNTSQRLTQLTQHHPQSSNRQPSNTLPKHSSRPQHSKPSKQSQSRPKSAKRQPNSKQPKLLRYEFKTNDKQKGKNKRKKKKKTPPGLQQKTKKPKRPVKIYEHHTYEYF